MHLSPREIEKLMLHNAGSLAQKRLARGLKLNHPEAVALIAAGLLEFIRDGRSVAELMDLGRQFLGRRQVMDGVAEMLVEVQVEGTFRKSQSSMFLGDDFPFGNGVLETTTTSTPVSVGAAYELDVWGRVRSTANAADLNLKAGVLDLVAFEMTLTAQITELWFMLAEVKNQSVLLREQLEANRTMLELVELRYTRGLASALDIHQQKVQMQGLEAQLPLIAARVKLFEHQLSVHMGQAPGSFNSTKTVAFPILTPVDNAGMPSTMLRMRPDVRAAEYRVRAAHGQVAAAIADRFPRVSLAASYGIPGHEGRPLFESFVWNLVGNVVAPVFDGGRRSAEVDRQRAIVEERVHAYGKTILVALREVEDALVSAKSQDHHVAGLEQQLVTAKLSLDRKSTRLNSSH